MKTNKKGGYWKNNLPLGYIAGEWRSSSTLEVDGTVEKPVSPNNEVTIHGHIRKDTYKSLSLTTKILLPNVFG